MMKITTSDSDPGVQFYAQQTCYFEPQPSEERQQRGDPGELSG